MRRLTISVAIGFALFLTAAFPGFVNAAPGDKSTIATLETSGPVTSPSVIDYRWADLAQNGYAQTYIDLYTYGDALVTVEYETGLATFTGTLHAENLKPNFAYQLKIVGKPEALFDPVTEGGDDVSNEFIGYKGRWWEVAPGTGNRNDAYYEAHKNDPAYIFEAYLLFDFFLTDSNGDATLDFALDSSYHVLFWDWQRSQGSCDHPLKTTTVSGSPAHDAYDVDVGPTPAGVFPEIERLCYGTTVLPMGHYSCRVLLTEESFHTSDGNWAPAMINNDIQFNIGEGLFPPNMDPEPTYTAGTDNTVFWNAVPGAMQYFAERSTSPDYSTDLVNSGWTEDLFFASAGLADGQIYYYRVKANDVTLVESSWSATVSSTQDVTAPSSSAGGLPATYTGSNLSIPFTASDAVSGVDFVHLFYSVNSGAYAQYGGTFDTSPINFIIPGDGAYDFYTVATDNVGNEETATGSSQASSVLTVASAPDPMGISDYIDIGTLESENQTVMGEAPHNMVGWGPSEPDTHGGGYGGFNSSGESCRPIWSPTEFDSGDGVERWADIDLDFGPAGGAKTLWLRHLDGGSPDSFDVYIDEIEVATIPDVTSSETWFWSEIDVTGIDNVQTVRIESIGAQGSYYDPYGQVCIDIISICGEPALFEALPVDADPIACGQSKQVDFHFTQGCEYIRGYTMQVRSIDGLSFDAGDVTVLDPSGTGDVVSSVTENAVDDWTITYEINNGSALPIGIPSGTDLFSIDFQGVSSGTGQVIIESVTVELLLESPTPVLNSVGATITVDCGSPAAPAAVMDISAEPGNKNVVVTWQDPTDPDLISLEIWRAHWYDADLGGASAYPEYSGLENDVVPTRPISRSGALASTEWELAGSVLPGEESFTDADGPGGLVRGIYYYEVFAADSEGLYGPRAEANDMATSYLLGDFDGDGMITVVPDINSWLALCYGTSDDGNDPPLNGYINECDVGPTDDNSGTGIPQPDDAVGFDDLMILAVNFDTALTKSPSVGDAFAEFFWTEVETGTWSLVLTQPCGDLKGLNLKADLHAGSVVSLSVGDLLTGQDCPVFLQNIDRHGLDTGLAMMSDGARIQGSGELLRVQLAEGQVPTGVTVDARSAGNGVIPCEVKIGTEIPDMPTTHQAFPNYPNPFNPSTRIEFELPATEQVKLSVFGLDGRRIINLVDGVMPAGRHEVIWTGRDDRGEIVAAGTYFYRLKAGTYTKTFKMTLLK